MTAPSARAPSPAIRRASLFRWLLLSSTVLPFGAPAFAQSAAAPDAPQSTGLTNFAPATAAAGQPPASTAATAAFSATAAPSALSVLLSQARYWRDQSQLDQAQGALDRAAAIDPRNPDVLALQAQLATLRGDPDQAHAALEQLRQTHPAAPQLVPTERMVRIGKISPEDLAEARRLASSNHGGDAIRQYQRIFNGTVPPDNLALEYYQTLAGTDNGWNESRNGVAAMVAHDPQNAQAQLAYARILTYRDATRAEGLRRLSLLSKNPAVASSAQDAWRQALQWLPASHASIPPLEEFLARHPDDSTIQLRLALARNPPRNPADEAGEARSAGFTALDAGHLAEAEQAFQSALVRDPKDADALGGLGIVRLRQGRQADARAFLQRAIDADPAHRNRWLAALSGASIGEEFSAARAMLQRKDYAGAERELQRLRARGNGSDGLLLMLAQAQAGQGRDDAAETSFRTVLKRQPGNAGAAVGLASLLYREGRGAEADDVLNAAQLHGNQRVVGQVRAEQLRLQAEAVTDPGTKEGLYRAALEANPANAWMRLDLARTLRQEGRLNEARSVMAEATNVSRPSTEAIQAGIIFANETGDTTTATALINRLPARSLTPELRQLRESARVQGEIQAASLLPSPQYRRERLLTLAAAPDPDGSRGAAIAHAFTQMRDFTDARQAIETAMAVNRSPSPAARLAYAGALMEAKDQDSAAAMLASLDGSGLTPDQEAALSKLRSGLAVQTSDRLNNAGQTADAYDQLAPALARSPDDPDLNMALARLYASANRPREALAIVVTQLRRDPSNATLRHSAVDNAIQAGDYAQAETLVQEGMQVSPNEPSVWLAAADLARSRGRNQRAMLYLEHARDLRRQQLMGSEADNAASYQLASLDQAPATENPFRNGPPTISDTDMSPLSPFAQRPTIPSPLKNDALTNDINRQIASLQEQVSPSAQASVYLRSRSGSSGIDKLTEVATPLQATFTPGYGTVAVEMRPTFLTAGTAHADFATQAQFGTMALYGGWVAAPSVGSQDAAGVGLDVKYALPWLSVDAGSSPLGFKINNFIGGIEAFPEIAPGWRLRLTGERRAVTDSLLSYAGARDPRTGITWGGVVDNRAHMQLEYGQGRETFYIGAGGDWLNGQHVANNTEWEVGAGGTYPVYKDESNEVRVGLDLVYFGFDKNEDFFTLGQGGYFSPQSDFAALIPVTWKGQMGDDLTWQVGGAVGYQTYHENSANAYPLDPGLQRWINSISNTPGVQAVYPSSSQSGITGNVHGRIEYRVSPSLRVGAEGSYQSSGNWNEASGTVFARYLFNGVQ